MRRKVDATEQYQDKMDKFRKKNWKDAERIERLTESLSEDPYHNTKVSRDPKAPSRIARAGNRRLFYQYCKDCRLRGVQNKIHCADCAQIPDETIRLLDFDHRDTSYDKKRHR